MANPSAAKQRRQARRSPPSEPHPVDENNALPSSSTRSPCRDPPSSNDVAVTRSPLPPASLPKPLLFREPISMSRVRLLITSLGNPPPYHLTRHSAGHILLRALASQLGFPPLTTRSKEYANGFISTSDSRPDFMLWQSPSLMNISGQPVSKAWRTFSHAVDEDTVLGLVVLHDELETAPGTLKVKRGETSAKGHNGIKSVQASLQAAKLGERMVKIGIGIGRPLSRDREDVSGFVLGQLTSAERAKVEGSAALLVDLLEKEVQRLGKL